LSGLPEGIEAYEMDMMNILAAHRGGRRKGPTALVQVPRALVFDDESNVCLASCIACAVGRGGNPRIDADTVATLCAGSAIPLRILLVIYRWARAYASLPGSSTPLDRIYNATERLSIKRLIAESVGGGSRSPERAVYRGIRQLKECRLIVVAEDPGRPTVYVPHAVGDALRLPQHTWTSDWITKTDGGGNFVLDGCALLVLIRLVDRSNQFFARKLPQVGRSFAERAWLLCPEEDLQTLPFSHRRLNAALKTLAGAGLVARVRTRGAHYVIPIEPA
jgi:hypothetical protein